MKFFVDTADVDAIRELHDLGMVDGVTTNPSLILKSGRDILEVTKEICSFVEGPVSAEVVALKADEMIAEGRKLAGIAPEYRRQGAADLGRAEGLQGAVGRRQDGQRHPVLQRQPGAAGGQGRGDLHQPFIGRLDDINLDGLDLIADIRRSMTITVSTPRSLPPRSARSTHAARCALIGADVMTAPPSVIKAMAGHVLTDKGLEQFMKDWAKTGQKIV
jgi:transaldolase